MPHANLTITVPESVWIGDLSRSHPDALFRVLAATTTNDDAGVARLEIVGSAVDAIRATMRAYDAVTGLTVFEAESDRCRVQVETTMPLLLEAIEASGVPLETPVEIRNGAMELETTLPQARLSALGDQLDAFDIPYTVDRIQQDVESAPLLTDRQRRLLYAAIDHGYYDTPRRITLTELAAELDYAASTCSEVLHRAEERVVKQHVRAVRERQPDLPVPAD